MLCITSGVPSRAKPSDTPQYVPARYLIARRQYRPLDITGVLAGGACFIVAGKPGFQLGTRR